MMMMMIIMIIMTMMKMLHSDGVLHEEHPTEKKTDDEDLEEEMHVCLSEGLQIE